jgi:uncharacterized protein YdaU (DUF1376 family)
MKQPPAFQFYPADFLADENVMLMNNRELGCYMRLMCYTWREGSIPNDIEKIAKLCVEDGSAMAQLWLAISSCFERAPDRDDRLVHPRLDLERLKQQEHRKERAESGKKGAKSRWNKHDGTANGSAIAQPMANDGSSSSTSPISKSKSEEQKRAPGEKPPADDQPPADPIWGNGLDFLLRKGIAKGAARSLIGLMRKHLQDDFIVAELLIEAERQDICAPQAWLLQAAKQRKNGGTNANSTLSGKLSLADRAAKLMLERDERNRLAAEATIVGQGPGRALAHDG